MPIALGPILAVVFWVAPVALALLEENIRLSCAPRTFHVLPGEPLRVELTIESASAAPVRLHLPSGPLLMVRAVEKHPVQRTAAGVFLHKRVAIWQALEPGTAKLDALSVETQGRRLVFPEITIIVRDPGS